MKLIKMIVNDYRQINLIIRSGILRRKFSFWLVNKFKIRFV